MTRILLYTGKGGVGKTSVAAATALLLAERGLRTMALSTDLAHSLGDAYGIELGAEPSAIAPNLWAQEPDVYHNIGRYWHSIQAYVAELFQWHGLDEVLAEEMTILPGMDELGNLLWIADHVDSKAYDVIVVDAAPTGETLRLLSLPEASRWWVERIAPLGRRMTRLGGPLMQKMLGIPMPREDVFSGADRLLRRLEHLHRLLADPDRTSVRLVLTLEQTTIAEARRSFTYFHLFGYPADLVVANRILPDEASGYFERLVEAQRRYLPEVEQEFGPVPVRTIPYFDRELVGFDGLRVIGEALFGELDPRMVFYRGRPYRVTRDGHAYTLSVELPFTSRDQIGLQREADELVISVGSWRRTLLLPRVLLGARSKGARMNGPTLQVEFEAPAAAGARR